MEIRIEHLSMTYPSGKQALKDLNLELKAPSLIGLLGPNGAGKSTLMKLLVAALLPTKGEIRVDGHSLTKTERLLKAQLGYLPQYIDQWKREVDDYYLNFYVRHPKYLDMLPEGERLRISNSLSGMRRYSEMPLKLLKAEQLVGGEEAMDQVLRDLFNREIDPMYPYLTYDEFLSACALTEEDLNLE